MTYHYHLNRKPLETCPGCQNDLRQPKAIELKLNIDGQETTHLTQLDEFGILQDTPDEGVSAGFHASTECAKCGEMLINFPDVREFQEEAEFAMHFDQASGDEQMERFQNACQSHHTLETDGETAISIAINPRLPARIKTRQQAEAYIAAVLGRVCEEGWSAHIQIGPEHKE